MKTRFAVLFLSCLLLPQTAIADENGSIGGTTLELTVEAQSHVAPDEALIDAGVITSGTTPGKAMEANAQKMAVVIKTLKAAAIADKDIQTSYVSLNPEYNYAAGSNGLPPKITSYQANNTVSIIVRNLENVGSLLDTVVSSGANQVSGPNFSIENMSSAYDDLRKQAIDKAQKRAALYAAASGLKVKRIISISENNNAFHPAPVMGMMAARAVVPAAATPVATGELTLETTLDVKYELMP